jgi:hypothetical protein
VVSVVPAVLHAWVKDAWYQLHGKEAGWASVLVWTQRLEEKSFASGGDRNPVVPVRSHTILIVLPWLLFQKKKREETFLFIISMYNVQEPG